MNNLTQQERERYDRHLILPEIGEDGQLTLKHSSVLVVGAGGLGSPVLFYLAGAGIGRIGIMDDDTVSESNLQRQIMYTTAQIGEKKAQCAAERVAALNHFCKTDVYNFRITDENAERIVSSYDIVVDATDNLASRYIINDACVKTGKPFVHGSICEFYGQAALFNYKGGRTYRDLYPYHESIPEFSQPRGIIGALPGIVGSIEALETVKTLLGRPSLAGRLLVIDASTMEFNVFDI